jgi:hypothetical protein
VEQRRALVDIPDDADGLVKKREILADIREKSANLLVCADLISGTALASGSWLDAAKQADEGPIEKTREVAKRVLVKDQPDGAFDRHPLHWPLVFPEVFSAERPGFDAVIGNPPFLGGQKLTGSLGAAYREYLVGQVGHGVRGSADIIAYFLLRAHEVLNAGGQTGLIATNTLAQGDTREVGLDQVAASGTEIRQAIKSKPWPSRSAVLEYAAVWTTRTLPAPEAERRVDGLVARKVTTTLDPAARITGNPRRLAINSGRAFVGVFILGMGFTMEPGYAKELIQRNNRNKEVLFPYLNGQDLNSRCDSSASRWVINFHDWPEERAKMFPECYDQVVRLVKPEREQNNDKKRREIWWRFTRSSPELYASIRRLKRVVVIARVSKTVLPVMVPTGQVFSIDLNVFATDDTGMLALLSSAPHYWWAISRGSTMKGDLRYTPSDVFDTLPLPDLTLELGSLGSRLDAFWRDLMLARQAGLTATYNLVHDPKSTDDDIAELREIHKAIDVAVTRAYGWTDLLDAGLDHGFHDTRQGTRYTIGPAVRQEILDRLLELNHARYAEEVRAGLHNKKISRKKPLEGAEGDTLFDM